MLAACVAVIGLIKHEWFLTLAFSALLVGIFATIWLKGEYNDPTAREIMQRNGGHSASQLSGGPQFQFTKAALGHSANGNFEALPATAGRFSSLA